MSPFDTPQAAITQVGLARGQGTQYVPTTTLHGGDTFVIYGMWTVFNAWSTPAPQPVVTLQLVSGRQKLTPQRMRVWPRSHVALWPPRGDRWPAEAAYRGTWQAVITVRLGRTSDSVRLRFQVV
jgi:hypothetical protein